MLINPKKNRVLNISDDRKAVVFVFQQLFKDMKEEDQHTKIPSPHRTLSLNPPPLYQHTHTHTHTLSYKSYNKHADNTLITNMKNYPFIVFSVGSVFILNLLIDLFIFLRGEINLGSNKEFYHILYLKENSL